MRIIGIDPGSVVTGIGIIDYDGSRLKLIDYDVVKMSSKEKMHDRLKKIYDCITEKITKFKPSELAIETAFYGKNVQSTMKLGQVRGSVIIAALNQSVNVSEYSPREVKKSVTGSGASSKEHVQYMVRTILSLRGRKMLNDSSDALAIALCHHYVNNGNIYGYTKRKLLKGKSAWKDFVEKNPDKILRK